LDIFPTDSAHLHLNTKSLSIPGLKKSSTTFPGLFFQFHPANRHITFATGLDIYNYRFESRTTYKKGVDIHDYNSVSYNAFKLPIAVGLDFGHGKIRPFARAGAIVSALYNKKAETKREYTTVPPLIITTPSFEFQGVPLLALLEAGVQIEQGKLFASLKGRYEWGHAPFTENASKTGTSCISQQALSVMLSIGYNFKRN
jgi:hypothetical protein